MKRFEIQEPELEFFELIDAVEKGASFLITRNGIPAARLVPAQFDLPQVDVERHD
jgi:prevent-host-death family protein